MRRDAGPPREAPRSGKAPPPKAGLSPFDVVAAEFAAEARTLDAIPPATLPELAFAGRSNVGKSTLLNAICQRKSLARTSRTPGCTRGIVVFDVRLRGGQNLRFVDLPGYGYAERSKTERRAWGPLIEKYLSKRPTLQAVMLLVDVRRGPEDEEIELIGYLSSLGVPFVFVATKLDKVPRSQRSGALEAIRRRFGAQVVGVSGETGEGRDELVRVLARLAFPPPEADAVPDPSREPEGPDAARSPGGDATATSHRDE